MEIINFTPYSALIGGALIGLSAAVLLLFKGRIAGISGIAGGVILPEKGDMSWRILFLLGLVIGGLLYQLFGISPNVESIQPVTGKLGLIFAGLLVGIGSALGTGCTSGHGICGLARRSFRSLIATLTFMLTRLLVCDEPTSALDVSIQAQILNLLKDLQEQLNLTILFISHDLPVVRQMCDRIGVLKDGKLCEVANTEEIFLKPQHDYTKKLLHLMPKIESIYN